MIYVQIAFPMIIVILECHGGNRPLVHDPMFKSNYSPVIVATNPDKNTLLTERLFQHRLESPKL